MADYGYSKTIDAGGSAILKIVGTVAVLLVLLILFFSSWTTVRTGNVGVLVLFGRVTGETLDPGFHLVNPFKSVKEISTQTQEIKETASVPSSEGLVMGLDTSLIFHLDPKAAAKTVSDVTPPYEQTLVEPILRSSIRSVTANHSANALYSSARDQVAAQIMAELQSQLGQHGVIIENVLLRDIQLPAALKQSIESKQQAEQESLAMSFRLQKEKQEADRKRIEAEGIRDFSRTVAAGISPELLTWKGIEATEKLADSQNAKIVVIGNTKNGLPLVMGQ